MDLEGLCYQLNGKLFSPVTVRLWTSADIELGIQFSNMRVAIWP